MVLSMNISTFKAGLEQFDILSDDARNYIESVVDLQAQKIQILEEQLRIARRTMFGRKSERYDEPGQERIDELREQTDIHLAQTLDSVLAATDADGLGAAEANQGIKRKQADTEKKLAKALKDQKKKTGGRFSLPEHLKKVETVIELPEDQRLDSQGNPLVIVDYVCTESLGYHPAEYFTEVEKRAIYGRPYNDDVKKVITPSQRIFEKSQLSNGFIAALVHAKFHDHMPMYRIEQHLETAGLAHFPRQKLGRALMHVALLPSLQSVYAAIKAEICAQPVI